MAGRLARPRLALLRLAVLCSSLIRMVSAVLTSNSSDCPPFCRDRTGRRCRDHLDDGERWDNLRLRRAGYCRLCDYHGHPPRNVSSKIECGQQ
jgi:hypothetical protein